MPAMPPIPSLSERQRQYTKRLHRVSGAVVAGKLMVILNSSPELYARALSTFYPIICAIEEGITKRKEDPQIKSAATLLETLTRRPAMEADLQHYLGANWQQKVHTSPALHQYTQYVAQIERERPLALLAFLYTNYMAFCSGGNIIKARVTKMFHLTGVEGTRMFEFEGGAAHTKQAIKAWFNGLPDSLTDSEQSLLVEECGTVFRLNNAVLSSFPVGLGSSLQAALHIMSGPRVLLFLLAIAALIWALVAARAAA